MNVYGNTQKLPEAEARGAYWSQALATININEKNRLK